MKALLLTILTVTSISLFANADGPRVEPGPEQEMEADAIEASEVLLMATPPDLSKFTKSGNQVLKVTRQNWQPGVTIYRFSRKQCTLGGAAGRLCLGGADLEVVVREVRTGSHVKITATSKVYLYR